MTEPLTDLYTDPRTPEPRGLAWPLRALLGATGWIVAGALLLRVAAASDDVERWRPIVSEYDWDADLALAVIRCESGGNARVLNYEGSGAAGLFQLMGRWKPLARTVAGSDDLTDPRVNVATAYALYGYFGWHPWDSSRGCWG